MVGAGDHGCWLGWYERDKAKLLAAALITGSVFYDVGANVGFYSLLGAACVGFGGRVIAFEPVPENLVILQKHIAMNQLANVMVIPAAVSDSVWRLPVPGRCCQHDWVPEHGGQP